MNDMNETDSEPKKKRSRGIYLLPNLFTTAALFSGFYAILASMSAHYEPAAIAIFVAMLLDGLDGRVARMTNTQTDFGAEYDSLSDMVAFGLAPSLVMYQWALHDLGKIGWLAAFVYAAAAALRLARFNTQLGKSEKRYFQGLPSPAAAAILAGAVWVGADMQMDGDSLSWLAAVLTIVSGLLMVSNIRFRSFKDFDIRGKVPFVMLVGVMLLFALFLLQPPLVLFLVFFLYAVVGVVTTLVGLQQKKRDRQSSADNS